MFKKHLEEKNRHLGEKNKHLEEKNRQLEEKNRQLKNQTRQLEKDENEQIKKKIRIEEGEKRHIEDENSQYCFSTNNVKANSILQLPVEFEGIRCLPLKDISGNWNIEINNVINAKKNLGKSYLTRVVRALENLNSDCFDSKRWSNALTDIRTSICDFPTQYQLTLRKVMINLMFRAAMKGDKDALYDIMDTSQSPQDLAYVSINFGNEEVNSEKELPLEIFKAIGQNLEELDINEVDDEDTEGLKEIFKQAILKSITKINC